MVLLNMAWQIHLETEFWETAEQPFCGISEIRGAWVAQGSELYSRKLQQAEPSEKFTSRSNRDYKACLLFAYPPLKQQLEGSATWCDSRDTGFWAATDNLVQV